MDVCFYGTDDVRQQLVDKVKGKYITVGSDEDFRTVVKGISRTPAF